MFRGDYRKYYIDKFFVISEKKYSTLQYNLFRIQYHPVAYATHITIMPDCHMPFHWPRLDKDLLLCVRITDIQDCAWSGGIRLDDNYSLTINVRDMTGKMHFLRIDVVLQEVTFFIVFTDADTMPPPIRVDNFSEVPLVVNQVYYIIYWVLCGIAFKFYLILYNRIGCN